MLTIILAGGFGTRLSEETHERPKPLVQIGGKPILWHIMMIYSSQGYKDFLIAGGYKCEMLEPELRKHFRDSDDVRFEILDTGLETGTGGRLKKCFEFSGVSQCFATYGDGVSNVDLNKLLQVHHDGANAVTLTSVRPPARFGRVVLEGNKVIHFGEKNQADEGWINGGFFALNDEVINYISNDSISFEQFPLTRLAEDRKLGAYLHEGFWQPMDTLREKKELENLWGSGSAPWKLW